MIQCEKNKNGGTIRAVARGHENLVEFWVSDDGKTPLTLSITEQHGNDPRITVAIIESLIERYGSPVVWFTTPNAELRYSPFFNNSVYRYSTTDETSLYTRPFKDGKTFSRIYALAEAMSKYSLVKSINEELQIFDRYAILSKFRKALKPLEFLSLKEECDYNIQTACVDATRQTIQNGKENLDATGSYSAAFEKVLRELEEKQKNGSYSFDAKTAYLREVVVGVCLPAIVLFGSSNSFTQAVTEAFVRGAAQYARISEELLEGYEDALKNSKEIL